MAFPGKIVKEFPPSFSNARNSEGDFIALDDGAIAFVYTRFRGRSEDGGIADLALSVSADGGETFSPEKIILTPEECDAINIMSVTLLKMQDGAIGLFYLKKFVGMQCKLFLRKTRDFTSFSDEICCITENGYYTVNNDRVVRLKNGRLIFPAGYTNTDDYDLTPENSNHDYRGFPWPPSKTAVYESDDDGLSWSRIAVLDPPFKEMCNGSDRGLQEPGLIELNDGRLYMYFRNNTGRQLQSFSLDGGKTWSDIEPSRFTSPPSPLSTLKLSDGRILIGYNPVPHYFGRPQLAGGNWTGGRNPYVLELADGNMNALSSPKSIESDPNAGFCYCAMLETDDSVLLGYCAGGEHDKGGCLTRLRIRKIEKCDL